jgi:RecB family endonuclease NucS
METRPDEVRLIMPSVDPADVDAADLADFEAEGAHESFDEELAAAEEITFSLERDLQAALRKKIEQLEPGLKIIDDGRERTTEAGRIDITAVDAERNIVIIELKAGTAPREVIAQVLAYMAAIREADGQPVRGILVAGDFDRRVILAARAIPNLELRKYSFQFTFEPVD